MLNERDAAPKDVMKVNVAGYIEQGRNALRAHRTQVDPDGQWFSVSTEFVEEVYPFEDFEMMASRVGWDSHEMDLFEGIA